MCVINIKQRELVRELWAEATVEKVYNVPSRMLLNIRRTGTDPMSTETGLYASHPADSDRVKFLQGISKSLTPMTPRICA